MIIYEGKKYFKPSEIAKLGLIVNGKGKGDYNMVLKLIREGELKAMVLNAGKKVEYSVVSEDEIKHYNDNRFTTKTV